MIVDDEVKCLNCHDNLELMTIDNERMKGTFDYCKKCQRYYNPEFTRVAKNANHIFIFREVEKLTSNYHERGGLVVIAKDLEAAINLAQRWLEPTFWRDETPHIKLSEEEIAAVISFELAKPQSPWVYVFPNAGCC